MKDTEKTLIIILAILLIIVGVLLNQEIKEYEKRECETWLRDGVELEGGRLEQCKHLDIINHGQE